MTPPAIAVLAAVLAAAGLTAQTDPPAPPAPPSTTSPAVAPPTASSLLQRLAARDTPLELAKQICAQLQDRPAAVRMQRFDFVQRRYADQWRGFAKARERLQRQFAKAVPKAQRQQLGKGGELKVAALRAQALAISHAPELSKQRIRAELDPLLQQLRELVLTTPESVARQDEALGPAIAALRVQLGDVRGWFDLYLGSMQDLDEVPGGRRHVDLVPPEPEPPPAAAVDEDLHLLCLSALPLTTRDQQTILENGGLRPSLDPEEFLGTLELNEIRIALGLPALRIDPRLGNAARDHSRDMQALGFFSHESPVEGKRTFGDRAARAGTSAAAENIAAGHETGAAAIRGWWYSPGHHRNMLGGFTRTGLGRADQLWTQMFGG